MGDVPVPEDSAHQGLRRAFPGGGHDQRPTREHRHAEIPERGVETPRRELQHPRTRPRPQALTLRLDEPPHAGVGHEHGFGAARRARGVDDVRRVARAR